MNYKDELLKIASEKPCYRYDDGKEYAHGRTIALIPIEYAFGCYGHKDTLFCAIAFTDGHMGSFAFSVDESLLQMFNNLKRI